MMGDETRKLEMNAALWAIDKVLSNLTELRAKVRRNAEGYAQANADAKVAECNAQADALTAAIAALSAPTPAHAVRALVGKWREMADDVDDTGSKHQRGTIARETADISAKVCRARADELEAALSAAPALLAEVARLREIEHRCWHMLDNAKDLGESIGIERNDPDHKALDVLLPEDHPEGGTPADARMLRKANHGLADELDQAEALLRRVKEDGNAYLLPEIEAFLNRGV